MVSTGLGIGCRRAARSRGRARSRTIAGLGIGVRVGCRTRELARAGGGLCGGPRLLLVLSGPRARITVLARAGRRACGRRMMTVVVGASVRVSGRELAGGGLGTCAWRLRLVDRSQVGR